MHWTVPCTKTSGALRTQFLQWAIPKAVRNELGIEDGDRYSISVSHIQYSETLTLQVTSGGEIRLPARVSEILQRQASESPGSSVTFAIHMTTGQGKDWSNSELAAAIDAYLWMLAQESQGKPYSKAEVNRQLRNEALANRSKSSIEYRMQNISAALEELCLPRIAGYLPAKNIGAGVKDRIRSVLADKGAFNADDYAPSDNEQMLSQRVSILRRRRLVGIPRGIKTPQRITGSSSSFVRDPLVKAWVLQNATGICEGCVHPAPFTLEDGSPFLEVHHVHPLAEGGADQISNAVALCPNCHRRCHLSSDRKTFAATLYSTINRLVSEQ